MSAPSSIRGTHQIDIGLGSRSERSLNLTVDVNMPIKEHLPLFSILFIDCVVSFLSCKYSKTIKGTSSCTSSKQSTRTTVDIFRQNLGRIEEKLWDLDIPRTSQPNQLLEWRTKQD